jgi:hypothetical protein
LGGTAQLERIAEALGEKRPRDLLRDSPERIGAIAKLASYDIVVVQGEECVLSPTWRTDLEMAQELLGENESARRDERLFEDQRQSYAEFLAEQQRKHRERTGVKDEKAK